MGMRIALHGYNFHTCFAHSLPVTFQRWQGILWIPFHAREKLPTYEFWAVYRHSCDRCTLPRKICIPCLLLTICPKSYMELPCKKIQSALYVYRIPREFHPNTKILSCPDQYGAGAGFWRKTPFLCFPYPSPCAQLAKKSACLSIQFSRYGKTEKRKRYVSA